MKRFNRRKIALLPWPKPPGGPHYVACHFCDTLHHCEPIPERVAARCTCCGAVLYQNCPASLVRVTAFSMTALLLMAVVAVFPFLEMDVASLRSVLSLTSASQALIHEGSPILGIALALFTIVAPIVISTGLIYVCAPLLLGKAAPGARWVAKWLSRSEPWNMVEVFLLGVLVSLLKLAKVADVHFGVGFWAFGLLMVCMAAAMAAIDQHELWDRLEVAKR